MALAEVVEAGTDSTRIWVAPGYRQITEQWFTPGFWGARARPVDSGGRGGAWLVHSEQGEMVLRHYRRGGLAARLAERSYFFTGFERVRSVRELRLLHTLKSLGLPVPGPVAAYAVRQGLRYQTAILVERIPNAVPLPDAARVEDPALWHQVGHVIRGFHDSGLDHVDLNCDNILVADQGVYLIDFDRCRLRIARPDTSWKRRNLDRLHRSLDKRLRLLTEEQRRSLWRALFGGYKSSGDC